MKLEKNQVSDIIFGGGLTPDAELPEEEVVVPKDFDAFGDEMRAEENEEELMPVDEEVLEDEDSSPRENKKPSVTDLLMQQNQMLQQQIASFNRVPQQMQLAPEDQEALQTGKLLVNIKKTNTVLYNKINDFFASELGGNQSNAQINTKLASLRTMLKSDKWKDTDVSPFMEVVDAIELTENNTKKENQQLVQVINALQRDINGLKEHKENSFKQTVAEKENQALLTLKKAELEFGVKLKKGSEEAQDFVLLVQNGKDPRIAFMKAMGLKETDKVKRLPPKEVDLNPKVLPTRPTQAKKLADKLFGTKVASSSLFKR